MNDVPGRPRGRWAFALRKAAALKGLLWGSRAPGQPVSASAELPTPRPASPALRGKLPSPWHFQGIGLAGAGRWCWGWGVLVRVSEQLESASGCPGDGAVAPGDVGAVHSRGDRDALTLTPGEARRLESSLSPSSASSHKFGARGARPFSATVLIFAPLGAARVCGARTGSPSRVAAGAHVDPRARAGGGGHERAPCARAAQEFI